MFDNQEEAPVLAHDPYLALGRERNNPIIISLDNDLG